MSLHKLPLILVMFAALSFKATNASSDHFRSDLKNTCDFKALTCPNGLYIGVGRADITGSISQLQFFGYVVPTQIGSGLHTRLFSRCFIVAQGPSDPCRMVYVSVDLGALDSALKTCVVRKLQEKYPGYYDETNVMISATHTHSGPAGHFQYLIYQTFSWGICDYLFNPVCEGVFKSIQKAHLSLVPGRIYKDSENLTEANINRSPWAYDQNPQAEKNMYPFNTGKVMDALGFQAENGTWLGLIAWYPVHGTSLGPTNTLVSGDNKGCASLLFEEYLDPDNATLKPAFFRKPVVAFGSCVVGDVSPRTEGAFCRGTRNPCIYKTSVCPATGKATDCYGIGPGATEEESCRIICQLQVDALKRIYERMNKATEQPLHGCFKWVHQTLDMESYKVPGGCTTCVAAYGLSVSAGTTDNPNYDLFPQGTTSIKNPVLDQLVKALKPIIVNDTIIACQYPKIPNLPAGLLDIPYRLVAKVVDTQIFHIGNATNYALLAAVPGEFSTMAGRRLKRKVGECFGNEHSTVIVAGLANTYTHYVATPEEYDVQRYEGASTLYGRRTLDAYLDQFCKLAKHLKAGTKPDPGPQTPYYIRKENACFLPPTGIDAGNLGETKESFPPDEVPAGCNVTACFVSGNPRCNPFTDRSYFYVQCDLGGQWVRIRSDAELDTKATCQITHDGCTCPNGQDAPVCYEGKTSKNFTITEPGSAPCP